MELHVDEIIIILLDVVKQHVRFFFNHFFADGDLLNLPLLLRLLAKNKVLYDPDYPLNS